MKKRIALALSLVALLLVTLGGGVYAAGTHGPAPVNKLVGVGYLGMETFPSGLTENQGGGFTFTNPNCDDEITITQVSIFREDGSIVYQGPYIKVTPPPPVIPPPPETREVITRPMEPHEVWGVGLGTYMWTGEGDPADLTDPDNWLTIPEVNALPLQPYTVEIVWRPTTRATVCPLTGWQGHWIRHRDQWGNEVAAFRTESQMVNMTEGGH